MADVFGWDRASGTSEKQHPARNVFDGAALTFVASEVRIIRHPQATSISPDLDAEARTNVIVLGIERCPVFRVKQDRIRTQMMGNDVPRPLLSRLQSGFFQMPV